MSQPKTEQRGSQDPAVSVIVVTYNSALVIRECLSSLSRNLPDAEIVVVDNGSTDDTVALAQANERVRLVTGHGNLGFGLGVNLGARAASGTTLLVLNPDASIVSVDLGELAEVCQDRITGVVGCRMQGPRRRFHYLKFRAWGWRGELRWLLTEHFLVPRGVNLGRPRWVGRPRRSWVAGAAFLVSRREFLDQVGGFDAGFFLYYEDFDLCRSYGSRGLPIRTTDAVTGSHLGGCSSPRETDAMTGYALLGLFEYVAKWEGSRAARDAVARCFSLLGVIETTGERVRGMPIVGPRARRKSSSAARVRSWLVAAASKPPIPRAYGRATEAMKVVLTEQSADAAETEPTG